MTHTYNEVGVAARRLRSATQLQRSYVGPAYHQLITTASMGLFCRNLINTVSRLSRTANTAKMSHSKAILPPKPRPFVSKEQVKVSSNLFSLRRAGKSAPATIYVYDVHIEAAKPKMRNWAENLRAMRFFLVRHLYPQTLQ